MASEINMKLERKKCERLKHAQNTGMTLSLSAAKRVCGGLKRLCHTKKDERLSTLKRTEISRKEDAEQSFTQEEAVETTAQELTLSTNSRECTPIQLEERALVSVSTNASMLRRTEKRKEESATAGKREGANI